MADLDELLQELKKRRDELRVQMHLATKEAREEWEELEGKMKDFSRRAQLDETGEGVSAAVGKLGHEIKLGYKRLWKALKD